ncbi:hypothetical protein [Endozoicomonas ascidiicola]|uniref:hypothetical protein n=1 Tax=Endozoicomonas ascidiicola TaxID=1698521 RepID=UPI000A765699|nr:hypothetical protein [Endozoicomonas ascidiicola]
MGRYILIGRDICTLPTPLLDQNAIRKPEVFTNTSGFLMACFIRFILVTGGQRAKGSGI